MRNLSYDKNDFYMQFLFHANESHFHKNGYALGNGLFSRNKRRLKLFKYFDLLLFQIKNHLYSQNENMC